MAREKQGRGAPLHTPGVVRSHVLHSQVRGCRPTAGCHPRIWGASRGPFPASDCGLGIGKPCELLVPGGFPCARLPSGCLVHLWGKALPLGRSVLRSGLVRGGLGRFRPGPGARKHRLTIILPPLNEPAEACLQPGQAWGPGRHPGHGRGLSRASRPVPRHRHPVQQR